MAFPKVKVILLRLSIAGRANGLGAGRGTRMGNGGVMYRTAYGVTALLICTAVPTLIMTTAEALPQAEIEIGGTGACLRTGGIGVVVNGAPYCRLLDGRVVDQRLLMFGRRRRAVMPNPASVQCERYGGRVEVVNGPAGQTGYCHLPNGAVVEEWALFRGR